MGTSFDSEGRLRVRLKHSKETLRRWREEGRDATAAVIGLVLAVLGSIVWGYGDLVGQLLASRP